jgi:hypothetical protein
MHRAAARLANSRFGGLTGLSGLTGLTSLTGLTGLTSLTGLTGLTSLTANLHSGQSHAGVVFLSVISDGRWAN